MDHEQVVELRNGATHLAVVCGFAPIGKAFLRGLQEFGPGLIKTRTHGLAVQEHGEVYDFSRGGQKPEMDEGSSRADGRMTSVISSEHGAAAWRFPNP